MKTLLPSIGVLIAMIAFCGGTAQAVVVVDYLAGPAGATTLSANLATTAVITQSNFGNTYGWGTGDATQVQVLNNLTLATPATPAEAQMVLKEYMSPGPSSPPYEPYTPYTVTLTLDTTGAYVGGHTITSVDTYAFRGTAEPGRNAQTYILAYSVVGSAAFTDLTSVSAPADMTTGTQVHVTDSLGSIATGVDALRFTISGAAGSTVTGTAYSEFAIYGAPVPEPASVMLLGAFGAFFALQRARRKTA